VALLLLAAAETKTVTHTHKINRVAYCGCNLNPCDVKSIASTKLLLCYIVRLTLNNGGIPHHLAYP